MKRLALAIALGLAMPVAFAATPFDETRALNRDASVSLENIKGRIDVTTWDRAEIRIAGTRGEGTKAVLIEGDASDLRVKIEYPESSGWFSGWGGGSAGESELRVTVPAGVTLDVEAVSADVDVKGVAGRELSIDCVSGEVIVDTGAADVEIDTVSGDQRVHARSGDVSLESVSGDVELEGEVSGRISLEAVSGSLSLDSKAAAKQVNAAVVSGDVTLRTGLQPGGRIGAESLSGDLEVVLPAGTSAQVTASSFTGTIRSDQGKVDTEEHGPGSSLDTKLGSGDGRIELETFSGDLTLRSE
jgi:DUF4097 and DUF4098 domain-containing protein YvlB